VWTTSPFASSVAAAGSEYKIPVINERLKKENIRILLAIRFFIKNNLVLI
jgi:hypothetical protein